MEVKLLYALLIPQFRQKLKENRSVETIYSKLFEFLTRVDMAEKQWMVCLHKTRIKKKKKIEFVTIVLWFNLSRVSKATVTNVNCEAVLPVTFYRIRFQFSFFHNGPDKKETAISIEHIAASFLAIG